MKNQGRWCVNIDLSVIKGDKLKFRKFNGLDFSASEVGLGCWQLGGADWGDVSDAQAQEILAAAVESGVNFFDTADVYGAGRSEELIGKFLKTTKREIFVATKLGRLNLYPDKYTEATIRAATARRASTRPCGTQ